MLTRIHLDSNGHDLAVETIQDVEPILERNKQLRTMEQNSDWGREIAEIPCVKLVEWLNEEHARGNTDLRLFTREMDEIIDRKLKDPDNAYLRTDKPGLFMGWMGFGS